MTKDTYADTLLRAAFGRHDREAFEQLAPQATGALLNSLAERSLGFLRSAQTTEEKRWAAHALQITMATGARHPDRNLLKNS